MRSWPSPRWRCARARPAPPSTTQAAAVDASAHALAAGLSDTVADSSPHPRATFGLAKLALDRDLPAEEALVPLRRLAADSAGTPLVERARAALYLAALQARAGDRPGAAAALDAAGVEPQLRGWLQQAAGQLEVERGRSRVPDRTPSALVAASDDDPYLPPPPPPPPRIEPTEKATPHGFKVHPPAKKRSPHGKAHKPPPATAKKGKAAAAKHKAAKPPTKKRRAGDTR